MREIRVSRIEPKFIEYQWKTPRPDPQSFDPNQRYRLIITYNLIYVPHYFIYKASRAEASSPKAVAVATESLKVLRQFSILPFSLLLEAIVRANRAAWSGMPVRVERIVSRIFFYSNRSE